MASAVNENTNESLCEFKIIADSSSDIKEIDGVAFASAPLKIVTSEKEYVDDASLNVAEMVEELLHYNGKSSTSCPNPDDWLNAFGNSKYVFCVTITATLSGSYNSACVAKKLYEEQYPDRKVHVFNSLSTGPEMKLIIEKLCDLILGGEAFEDIVDSVNRYCQKTGLLFMLESMKNLANNGRVSPLAAKAAGLLGIRVVGKASDRGDLEQLDKSRGENRAIDAIVKHMKQLGHNGGKVRIAHCLNENAAIKLKERLQREFENVCIELYKCGGLCSFYAEKGGMLIGFEKA